MNVEGRWFKSHNTQFFTLLEHLHKVGNLKFKSSAIPKHDEMGFTPYFDKNIIELKGPIPLTIFNKVWKNAAILYHAEKRAREDNILSGRNHYTVYPYPSKWTQSFAEWNTNHQGFYKTLVTKYNYQKFGKWLLAHKSNTDATLSKDGFMATLRYNFQVQTHCFVHHVTLEDGTNLLVDILVFFQKVANLAYTTCRKFKELECLDNPYAAGGTRVL
ncbi:hypothetical protein PCANC_23779 [Puccinia coronata f. sp. avenae]|uniref:Uncharacterized protein n=1 Tax=Puccinia coronata f. sp. avenae TaxID=200324 RepID=A0A2N5SFF0_9BASI|nr:hypothetical protein PCANC_23779 [Puccinia coronata f. sp. avenae]PLW49648.1 hypothetical protein PCASD_02221 [Puccinia coronata f. sp. avenae]